MMQHSNRLLLLAFGLLFFVQLTKAQTLVFSDPGTSHNNSNGVTADTYGPVDVANCSSIYFSVEYNFSLPFGGPSNMSSSDECPPCQGDPNDPSGSGCDQCWDFLYVQFQMGGVNVNTRLVGVPGNTNQSGTLTFGPICTGDALDAGFIVQTQTWGDKTITFSNLTITCWDASASNLSVSEPACQGTPFILTATLTEPGAVAGTLWTGPGTIATPFSLNSAVNNGPLGNNTYTFTATDDNACTSSSTIEVNVLRTPVMDALPNITVCENDLVAIEFSGTGNLDYTWSNSNTEIGLDSDGTGNIYFLAQSNPVPLVVGVITVVPTEDGCVGPSQTFTISTRPNPIVFQHHEVVVCEGETIWVLPTGTPDLHMSPTQHAGVHWESNNPNVGLLGPGWASLGGGWGFVAPNVSQQEVATITMTPQYIDGSCPGPPIFFTVTVNPRIPLPNYPDRDACAGEQVEVSLAVPGFTWTNSNPAIGLSQGGVGDISFVAANVTTKTTGTIIVSPGPGCWGPPTSFSISVYPIPMTNPINDIEVCDGASIYQQISGTLGALHYWTNSNTATGLPAFGNGHINFTTAEVFQQEVSTITITPIYHICPGDPTSFNITVNPTPTVYDPGDKIVCAYDFVAIEFDGIGNSTYSWTNSNTDIGLEASGTENIYFIAGNVTAPTTSIITVTPTDGDCPGLPQSISVTVMPTPAMDQPAPLLACAGTSVDVLFSAAPGISFNWTNSNPAIGLDSSGSGNISFTAAMLTTRDTALITVTPIIGNCQGAARSFMIVIEAMPTLTAQPDLSVCSGLPVTVNFLGSHNPAFNWENSDTGIGLDATGTDNIYFIAGTVTVPTTSIITVTPTENGCAGLPDAFLITVLPTPHLDQPDTVLACSGTSVAVPFSAAPGVSFNWTNSNPAIGLDASGSGNISFTAAMLPVRDSAFVNVIPIIGTCQGIAQVFLIAIEPSPTMSDPPDLSVCSGSPVAVNFLGSHNPTFNWANSNTGIGLGSSGTGNIDFTADSTGQSTIIVTPSANGCLGASQNFDITVNELPVVNHTPDMDVCVGDSVILSFVGTTGTDFLWTNSDPAIGLTDSGAGGVSFVAPNVAVTTTGNISVTPHLGQCAGLTQQFEISIHPLPSLGIESVGCAPDLLSYQINFSSNGHLLTATAGIIIGSGGNYALSDIPGGTNVTIFSTDTLVGCQTEQTVNAPDCNCSPVPLPTTPNHYTICEGEPNPAMTVSTSLGNTVDWYTAPTGGTLLLTGSSSYTPPGTFGPGIYTFYAEARESTTNCTSSTRIGITLTVNTLPVVAQPADQAVCAGSLVSINFTGTTSASMGWTNSNTNIGLGTGGQGNISFLTTNAGTANLLVTPSLNGCTGVAQMFAITVNPIPSLAVDSTVCSADLSSFSIYGSSNVNTLDASAGIVSFNGTNFTVSGVPNDTSVVLTITDTATGCSREQFVAGVNCFCLPILPPSGPNAPEICEGDVVPALTVGIDPGLTVDWYSAPTGGIALQIGSTSYTPSGPFAPGVYTFYAEGRESISNCASPTRIPVTLTVRARPDMSLPMDQVVCEGDIVSVAFAGTAGSSFGWANTNPNIGLAAVGTGNLSFTTAVTGMAQTAQVIVTPQIGMCSGPSQTFSIAVNPIPVVNISGATSICNGGGTTLIYTGGGSSVLWSNGATTASINVNPSNTNTYTATVTENGCTASNSVTVTVGQPSASTVQVLTCDPAELGTSISVIPNVAGCDSTITTVTTLDIPGCSFSPIISNGMVSCFGAADGTLMLSATGGFPPYNFVWSNGTQSGTGQLSDTSSSVQIQNLPAGNYTVSVTAANGITSTISAQIGSPALLTAQATAQIIFGQNALSCHGATDAVIQATANGGTSPFEYSWSVVGQHAATLTGIGAGAYGLTVTDANQCTATSTALILNPPPLAFELFMDNPACGDNHAIARIIPVNGTAPFSVTIDGVFVSGGLMPWIPAGNHLVELSDAYGCSADTMLSLNLLAVPTISLPVEVNVKLGEILVLQAQTNLTSWKDLSWTPTPNSNCPDCLRQEWLPEISGLYTVVITDDAGCTASATSRVVVKQDIDLYVPNVFSPNGDGLNDFWTLHAGESEMVLRSLQIFDRWGELLYFLRAPTPVNEWPGWEGNYRGYPLNPGVYVYYLEVNLLSGETIVRKGDVTLLR